MPRPLFYDIENVPFTKVNPENIQNLNNKRLVFGSFGMAFESKGFDHIVELINNEFDNALIRFHITISQYNDMEGKKHSSIIECVIGAVIFVSSNNESSEEIIKLPSMER